MNADQLLLWILRTLGAPIVKVELTREHLEDCIEDARRWFTSKKGVQRTAVLPPSVDGSYDLPPEVEVVTDVAFTSSPFDFSTIFAPFILPEQQIPYSIFAAQATQGMYSNFAQLLQYIETAKRIIGAEQDWSQEGRKLFTFPSRAPATANVLISYKTNQVTIEQLPEKDHDMLKRRALAEAKARLGRIRTKYDAFPTAQGSVTMSDGSALLDEARSELEALNEEIILSGYPMPILVG
jgi:hypothetical protein